MCLWMESERYTREWFQGKVEEISTGGRKRHWDGVLNESLFAKDNEVDVH